jgi:hypothetical protein
MKSCSWIGLATALAAAVVVAFSPSLGSASPFDHLKCYKIKAKPVIKALADLRPLQTPLLQPELGCKLKGPQLFCAPVEKRNVEPPPPGGIEPGPDARDRLCYKLKCPKTAKTDRPTLTVTDQFGTFTVALKNAFVVCTPAMKVPTTTTITTTTSTSTITTTTTTTTSSTTTTTIVPLDHFRVYNAIGPNGMPVTLKDQFHEEPDIQLGSLAFFLPPVDKNGEGIRDEVTHLACYPIPQSPNPFDPIALQVDNQFGLQGLQVRDPRLLCVPTEKDPGPEPKPLTRDHFKCYDAVGEPVGVGVNMADQFTMSDGVVQAPFLFCNPVEKTNLVDGTTTPITNPDEHLTCYRTDPLVLFNEAHVISNQFGMDTVEVNDAIGLCVPSKKILPCANSMPPMCGGECPTTDQTCVPTATAGCICQ